MFQPSETRKSRTVGILGGMGPSATADFYEKLIHATPAQRDQEHIRVVMWADPTVPDRSDAILNGGEDPTPWLEYGIDQLISCGAELLVVPCNTAHAYLSPVLLDKNIVLVSIIDAAIEEALRDGRDGPIGIIATVGTIASQLYQSALKKAKVEPIVPNAKTQIAITEIIYMVKTKGPNLELAQRLDAVLSEFERAGVSCVIAGCTEISTLLGITTSPVRTVDASNALAVKTVALAYSSGSINA